MMPNDTKDEREPAQRHARIVLDSMVNIAKDDKADAKVRIKAAKLVLAYHGQGGVGVDMNQGGVGVDMNIEERLSAGRPRVLDGCTAAELDE